MTIYLNDVEVKPTMFPDKTSQVWKLDLPDKMFCKITWKFDHEGEFMHLAQLKGLLDVNRIPAWLDLPYLPYGRQDKRIQNDKTFALQVFANLINHMDFNEVRCLDPHSEIAESLFDRFTAHYPSEIVQKLFAAFKVDEVVYPDVGAFNKYHNMYKMPYTLFVKKRDQSTGEITGQEIAGSAVFHIKDKNLLIVDDICDGGATFVKLAEYLYQKRANNVMLFVTHGIFSKGLKPLFDADIARIFTARGEVVYGDDHLVAYKGFPF